MEAKKVLIMSDHEQRRFEKLNVLVASKAVDSFEAALGKRAKMTEHDVRVARTATVLLAEMCVEQFERQLAYLADVRTAAVLSRTQVKTVGSVLTTNVQAVVSAMASLAHAYGASDATWRHTMTLVQRVLKAADDLYETGAWYQSEDTGRFYVLENEELRDQLKLLTKVVKQEDDRFEKVDLDLARDIRQLSQRLDRHLARKRYVDPFTSLNDVRTER